MEDVNQIIKNFRASHSFSENEIQAIRSESTLRISLVNHFRIERDREFALALLNTFIELRQKPDNEISMNDLMLAGLLLGMHGHVEDCLKVWKAKQVDFDSYCGVDIQLVVFAGVDRTISFLQTQTDEEAEKALKYVLECQETGDFEDLEEYYNEMQWWIYND